MTTHWPVAAVNGFEKELREGISKVGPGLAGQTGEMQETHCGDAHGGEIRG